MHAGSHMTGGAGTIVEKSDAGGLRFSRVVFAPRAVLGPHVHANAYLSFVCAGSYTERVGRLVRECDSSTLLYHEAGERHENVFHAEPVSLLRVEAVDSELLDHPPGAAAPEGFRDAGSRYLCRRILGELRHRDDLTPLALQGLAYELVAGLTRSARTRRSRGPGWLKTIDELLEGSFHEPLGLARIAAVAGVHPVHVARTYRQHRGQTIGDRIRDLRLQRACRLLSETRTTIAGIATDCGFADQSHLARLMRRKLGVSPTEYRATKIGR